MSKQTTIGEEINKLVKQYGNYTTGIYILERALQVALKAQSIEQVKVGGRLVCEHPTYLELRRKDDEALQRMNELVNSKG